MEKINNNKSFHNQSSIWSNGVEKLMVIFDPQIEIIAISGLLAVVSKIIQIKFIDKKKLKENQMKMKENQKLMKDLAGKEDPKSKNELERLEKEFMQTANETMKSSFRQMAFTTPIFLGAFWFLGATYSEQAFGLPVPIPWLGENGIELFSETNWLGLYFLSYLIITIILTAVIKIAENVRK
jgi:uncharacterized membrane protein (DUF106 family)